MSVSRRNFISSKSRSAIYLPAVELLQLLQQADWLYYKVVLSSGVSVRGPEEMYTAFSRISRYILYPFLISDLKQLKHITVSEKNYEILRGLGHTCDSMNDVITVILNKVLQTGDSSRDPQSTKTQVPNGDDSTGRVNRRF